MKSKKLSSLTKTALMVAVIAVMAQVVIPFSGVPLTLQTFAIAFCGYFLGAKFGAAAVAVYLFAGAVGLPVFAGFGATASLVGPTGGFLIGFLPMVFFCGAFRNRRRLISLGFSLLGLIVCHLIGVVWFSITSQNPPFSAFLIAVAPYLPKDILSLFLAKILAERVSKHL